MHRRLVALHALAMGALVSVAAGVPGCFPDPPADTGLLDSGIFISDGTVIVPVTDGATNGLTLSSQTVDFGLSECGGVAPKNQTLTLTNTSSGPITYAIAISGNLFAIAPTSDGGDPSRTTSGTIAPGESTDIALAALGVSTFATAGGLTEGAMQIVTNAPGQKLFIVDLRETALGAQLVMIPSQALFGVVQVGTTSLMNVGFRNNGNAPLSITFDDAASGNFSLQSDDDAGSGFTVAAGTTVSLQASWTPDGDSPDGQDIGFHTTGTLCGGGDPPSTIVMNGTHDFQTASITPGILTFDVGGTGFVPCGQAAKARTFTVANSNASGTPDLFITNVQVTSGAFTVSPTIDTDADANSQITLTQGNNQPFTVTPSTVTAPSPTNPEALSGTVDISYSGATSGTFQVQLSQTAQGAVLSFLRPSIDFGSAPLDFPTMQLLGVGNSGNAAVGLTLAITGSPYFTVSPSQNFSVNTPGGASTVTFLPIATGPAQGTLSLTPSGPVCSVAPPGITLTGNGSTDAGVLDTDAGDP